MKKDNLFDNCIHTDLKIIEKDLEILLLVWTALFALGLSWGMLVLAIPAIVGVLACLCNIFRKLCGSSLHGSKAVLYRSLPIPASTLVLSKIFTGGLVFAAMGVIYYLCVVFRALLFKDGISDVIMEFEGWLRGFEKLGIGTELVPLAAVLDFVNMVLRCFSLSAMILLGVTMYCSMSSDGKGRMVQHSMLYIGTLILVTYVLMAELPGAISLPVPAFLQLVLYLALTLVLLGVSYKISVTLLEKKDGGVRQ